MRYECGKKARWRRYDLTWQRYLRRLQRLGPLLKRVGQSEIVPQWTSFTRDRFAETHRQLGGRYSGADYKGRF